MQQAISNHLKTPKIQNKIGKENSPRLVNLTVHQIVTDFGMNGYPIRYNGKAEDAYDQLSVELKTVVEEIIRDGYEKLLALLANIGINEQEIKEKLSKNSNNNVSQSITNLILEKEFLKVLAKEGNNSMY